MIDTIEKAIEFYKLEPNGFFIRLNSGEIFPHNLPKDSPQWIQKQKEWQIANRKRYIERNITNKRFYCECCDYNAKTGQDLKKHLKTKKHLASSQLLDSIE